MQRSVFFPLQGVLVAVVLLSFMLPDIAQAAGVRIMHARWSGRAGQLIVRGVSRESAPVELYDPSGRLLGTVRPKANKRFKVRIGDQSPELLCSVRAKAGGAQFIKPVTGAPNRDCGKMPKCQITSPAGGLTVQANQDVSFKASAKLREKKAGPLKLEWDFSGGAMGELVPGSNPPVYQRPRGKETTVRFIRDNSRYRVRFTAMDGKRRYCEDAVDVTVGTPPATPPGVGSMVSQAVESAPKRGSEATGEDQDVVVLPFTEKSMVGTMDTRFNPNAYIVLAEGAFNSLKAQVFRKGIRPRNLSDEAVAMQYRATSNPHDPVGSQSINSTSQNWPLSPDIHEPSQLAQASIQKTDMWERYFVPMEQQAPDFAPWSLLSLTPFDPWGTIVPPDEGLRIAKELPPPFSPYPAPTGEQGRYMPGRDAPFTANDPQGFGAYWARQQWHTARAIPLTDIDDAGRVNPYPLLRVEAVEKQTGQTLAATETVLTKGKDVHCRGCHEKGGIGANDKQDWNRFQEAYHSSPFYGKECKWWAALCTQEFQAPKFWASVDREGQPSQNLFDREYAAIRNIGELHEFYANTNTAGSYLGDLASPDDHRIMNTGPRPCNWCHSSRINNDWTAAYADWPGNYDPGKPALRSPSLSAALHTWHGQLQKDPQNPGQILRETSGRPLRWNVSQGANPNSLFPTVDAQGNPLPMEQNCLQCHSGHREPLFRDRHYTAGLTCNDCHGDMLAVGMAHAKPKPGAEGQATRVEWYEEPNCGSCHTGNGNDNGSGFVSGGVLKQAFDARDPSATSRQPASERFAVKADLPTDTRVGLWFEEGYIEDYLTFSNPLYRTSHDAHGQVACAACHGDAHEIWPNRDPKANDNLTANQLQGFAGPVIDCNVCHSKDAFAELGNLVGGGQPASSRILGGPHGLHPMRDENWWKAAKAENGKGGWHDNIYRSPGVNGEDQCAACHGDDHQGTRLSKTPVDLKFPLGGGKVAQWKAGEEVGCNKCHSVAKSFRNGPRGYVAPPVNHDPVITSTPTVLTAVMGEPYSYQVTATDSDGDRLSFSVPKRPDSMEISAGGLVTATWPMSVFSQQYKGPFVLPYVVSVADGKGGYATQTISVALECPSGQSWIFDDEAYQGSCVADSGQIRFTSTPPAGVVAGAPFSYDADAVDKSNLELTYNLLEAPADMTIDAKSGLIQWLIPNVEAHYWFQVQAANSAGDKVNQTVNLHACVAPKVWHAEMAMCMVM